MIIGVIDLILADATCQGLISDKVFPVIATQGVKKPYVTIRRIGESPTINKQLPSDCDKPIIDIAIFGATYSQSVAISDAIRDVIDDYRGTQSGKTYHRIWYTNSLDMIDEEDEIAVIIDTYTAEVAR